MSAESNSARTSAAGYIDHGWSLCAVRPRSKVAEGTGWQERGRPAEYWRANPDHGMGLIHGLSGTCSLDLDDPERAEIALRAVGADLAALRTAPNAVRLVGAPGRGKLLYRAPEGVELSRKALNWPDPETGKQGAVLELRAGPVMDVLPPSIHPGTGAPYRWEGDWTRLPEIPAELLAVWENWTEAKRAMEAACPWNDTPAVAIDRYEHVERKRYAEGESVIAAFNEAHRPGPILEAKGYRRAGPRLISPHSSSGDPGVVFLPGSEGRLVYVHHASDPLCDGHAHDAFSVWLQLEHGGDLRRGVKAAAEILRIDHARQGSEEAREGAAIAARIMTPKPPPGSVPLEFTEDPAPPSDPIPVAALADLEHWLRARHRGMKKTATVQGALAFAAAMTMRRYVTWHGDPTNILLGIVDRSIAGLRPLKGALQIAVIASKERPIVRGTKLSSDATLHRALHDHPRMFWVSDDYGYMVNMSRRQPSGAIESVLGVLQTAYLGDPIPLDKDTIGGKRDVPLSECIIYSPAIAMLALVSEDQMREVTRPGEYGRGSIQQIFFAKAEEFADDESGSARRFDPIPASVVALTERIRIYHQKLTEHLEPVAYHDLAPVVVSLGPGSQLALIEVEAALGGLFTDDRLANWKGIRYGAMATIERLSASLAAWANPEDPFVTVDIVRWVGNWVVYHVSRMTEWYEVVATDDGEANHVSEIRERLVKFGKTKGMTLREIARRYHKFMVMPPAEQEDLMLSMVEAGLCRTNGEDPKAKSVRYIDASFLTPRSVTSDA